MLIINHNNSHQVNSDIRVAGTKDVLFSQIIRRNHLKTFTMVIFKIVIQLTFNLKIFVLSDEPDGGRYPTILGSDMTEDSGLCRLGSYFRVGS